MRLMISEKTYFTSQEKINFPILSRISNLPNSRIHMLAQETLAKLVYDESIKLQFVE